jgi:ADP-heptose:LPS heptosyltransferase
MATLGPLGDGPNGTIARIAVFRALMLGDLLCATPALRALKAAWPQAELTLIGLPWARELALRLPMVERFEAFPGFPGLPEIAPDCAALPAFLTRMQQQRHDLLVQLHGSGRIVNALLATFGARHVAGFVETDGYCAEPPLHLQWPSGGNEIERLLRLVDHLGIERRGAHLEFPLVAEDRRALARSVPELDTTAPYVCVHAGAQLPSRRWMPERFAAVADAMARGGRRIVLTGSAAEAPITRRVRECMAAPALDLAGRTSLFELAALVERAELVVCNDTGISHIAAALGTRSIVVSCGADTERWSPLDPQRHRVVWRQLPCRPCGHRDCPYEHECARELAARDVIAAAHTMLERPCLNNKTSI